MANDWPCEHDDDTYVDERSYVIDDGLDDGAGAETRYALTPLGLATLGEAGTFAGFGPCAASAGPSFAPELARRERRVRRTLRPRGTPLFG